MRFYKKIYYLPVLIVLLTIISGLYWISSGQRNTFITWLICFAVIASIIFNKRKYFHPVNKRDYSIVNVYLLWMVAGVIRGAFVAENYWEWKQLAEGSLTLSLPVLVYAFSIPAILGSTLKAWLKYALPLFLVFLLFAGRGSYHFYLGPALFLACFMPLLPKKWKIIFTMLLLLLLFADWTARSQVIKALLAFSMSGGLLLLRRIHKKSRPAWIKSAYWFLCALPVVLLILGITGTFNLFEDMASNKGKYVEKKVVGGEVVEDDISSDTRTFIYTEVIQSAVKHRYIVWGRTPARGNDSESFGYLMAEGLKTGKYERFRNEVCFPNVFTWLGLVGLLLYMFIYLKSAYLAIYRSNNLFIKIVGVFIAFHFMYGWVEDINVFDIMNASIWMAISMGFSAQFRGMNNRQFGLWLRYVFNSNKR
ncbi:hypothetical protein A8C56_06220 [Niabella ginsenosidivorans]|uniref:O-antigen polymerase n=1 Tax=Niabella ginsenosidivorans TaxID=1176587 RepID=A0A1A9I1P9_9BACT|nr:hypothetical protein [Niabella ginsenosidivorans]ANH80631.1 hypothetical protein A8C56_06220 [Niabella ginsenosidivorans]